MGWYFVSFLLLSLGTIFREGRDKQLYTVFLYCNSLFLVLLIGLRHEVGGDWITYLRYLDKESINFSNISLYKEPGYMMLNWLSLKLGSGIYGVNLMVALISLGFFSAAIKRWRGDLSIAFLSAFPVLWMVVNMGYTRQAAAVSITTFAYTEIKKKNLKKYISLVILASLFHTTAVVLISGYFLLSKIKFKNVFWFTILMGAVAWYLFEFGKLEHYLSENYKSTGTFQRLVLFIFPLLMFYFYRRRWQSVYGDEFLVHKGSWVILGLFVLFFAGFPSLILDRMGLYFFFLQPLIWSRIPRLLGDDSELRGLYYMSMFAYHLAIIFIWLNYAKHAQRWLPYQNFLWSD